MTTRALYRWDVAAADLANTGGVLDNFKIFLKKFSFTEVYFYLYDVHLTGTTNANNLNLLIGWCHANGIKAWGLINQGGVTQGPPVVAPDPTKDQALITAYLNYQSSHSNKFDGMMFDIETLTNIVSTMTPYMTAIKSYAYNGQTLVTQGWQLGIYIDPPYYLTNPRGTDYAGVKTMYSYFNKILLNTYRPTAPETVVTAQDGPKACTELGIQFLIGLESLPGWGNSFTGAVVDNADIPVYYSMLDYIDKATETNIAPYKANYAGTYLDAYQYVKGWTAPNFGYYGTVSAHDMVWNTTDANKLVMMTHRWLWLQSTYPYSGPGWTNSAAIAALLKNAQKNVIFRCYWADGAGIAGVYNNWDQFVAGGATAYNLAANICKSQIDNVGFANIYAITLQEEEPAVWGGSIANAKTGLNAVASLLRSMYPGIKIIGSPSGGWSTADVTALNIDGLLWYTYLDASDPAVGSFLDQGKAIANAKGWTIDKLYTIICAQTTPTESWAPDSHIANIGDMYNLCIAKGYVNIGFYTADEAGGTGNMLLSTYSSDVGPEWQSKYRHQQAVLNIITLGSSQAPPNNGFIFGAVKTAAVPITINPAGIVCECEVFLGPNSTTKSATSGKISFTSTGSAQTVNCPVTMPAAGTYHTYINITSGGVLFAAFVDPADVVVSSGISGSISGPIVWN